MDDGLTGFCVLIIIGFVLYAWRRDGAAMVLQRFRDLPRQIALGQGQRDRNSAKLRFVRVAVWIAMGLVLAVSFYGHK